MFSFPFFFSSVVSFYCIMKTSFHLKPSDFQVRLCLLNIWNVLAFIIECSSILSMYTIKFSKKFLAKMQLAIFFSWMYLYFNDSRHPEKANLENFRGLIKKISFEIQNCISSQFHSYLFSLIFLRKFYILDNGNFPLKQTEIILCDLSFWIV